MRARVRAAPLAAIALAGGCTDWSSFSRDYEGAGVCPAYVVAGDTHTCVRKTSGSLHCWGDNRYGQLGLGDARARASPTRVPVADVAKVYLPMGTGDLSADAANFTCVIDTEDHVSCWGDDRWGEMGTGHERELSPVAVNLPGPPSVAAIGAGHICTLDASGAVSCFGNNSNSQLGVAGPDGPPAPIRVEGVLGDKIVAGAHHTCVRRTDATMVCWGGNDYGQLGTNDTADRQHPTEVAPLAGRIARLAAGANHTCGQTPEGEIWCWGDNRYGQLGTGDRVNRLVPTRLLGAPDAAAKVYAGGGHSCAVHADGSFWCWGDNRSGQLGLGDTQPRLQPARVDALGNDVVAAYTGGAHTCVLRADGSVYCWGNNQYGQLGVAVGSQSTTPVRVMPACP